MNRSHARAVVSWLLPFALVGLLWSGFAFLHAGSLSRPAAVPGVIEAREGRWLPSPDAATQDAVPSVAAPRVPLPDDWTRTRPHAFRGGYLLSFELDRAPEGEQSLYLPSVNARPDLRLNGERLAMGGGFARPMARSWHVPVYATIPEDALRPGENVVWVGLEVEAAGSGYLGRVYVGPSSALRPAYEIRHFLQVSLVQIISLSVVLFSLLMAALFVLRRKESVYGWVAAVFAVWGLGFVNILVLDSRIPRPPADWVGVVSMGWFAALGSVFVNRLFGDRHWRVERWMLGGAALGTVVWTLLYPPTDHPTLLASWGGVCLSLALYPTVRVAREHHRRADAETTLMVTCGLVILTTAIHDVALVNNLIAREHDNLIQFAAVASVGVMAWIFLNRFIRALHTSELLTAELEERVEEKHREIEASYQRLRRLEQEQTLAGERERITGEIHDGLGGQLVSTLAMTESGDVSLTEVSTALRGALDDLRLMIHSLDSADHDLLTVLGTLRGRLEPRLQHAGIEMHWRVVDLPDLPELGPERVLHVTRILQEAVTNVLKHAKADHLTVRTGEAEGPDRAAGVFVEVEDDGVGLGGSAPEAFGGRGLASMRRRAGAVGGSVAVGPGDGGRGTRVRVWLPVGPASGFPSAGRE